MLGALEAEGFSDDEVTVQRSADARYPGQVHELPVPIGRLADGATTWAGAVAAFHADHDRQFGYQRPELDIEILHWRVTAVGHVPGPGPPRARGGQRRPPIPTHMRDTYDADAGTMAARPVYDADTLKLGMVVAGPAIRRQRDDDDPRRRRPPAGRRAAGQLRARAPAELERGRREQAVEAQGRLELGAAQGQRPAEDLLGVAQPVDDGALGDVQLRRRGPPRSARGSRRPPSRGGRRSGGRRRPGRRARGRRTPGPASRRRRPAPSSATSPKAVIRLSVRRPSWSAISARRCVARKPSTPSSVPHTPARPDTSARVRRKRGDLVLAAVALQPGPDTAVGPPRSRGAARGSRPRARRSIVAACEDWMTSAVCGPANG